MASPITSSDRLVRPRDAARILAISERKLWELTNRRIVRAVKIGRSVRYDVRDLEAFIAASKEGGEQ
jgi:predicted DNA-binding transcriptional regulator AlpA